MTLEDLSKPGRRRSRQNQADRAWTTAELRAILAVLLKAAFGSPQEPKYKLQPGMQPPRWWPADVSFQRPSVLKLEDLRALACTLHQRRQDALANEPQYGLGREFVKMLWQFSEALVKPR